MTVSIKTLYSTRYLYITYIKDLEYLFRCVADLKSDPSSTPHAGSSYMESIFDAVRSGDEVIYDFADCKITSSVAEVLRRYSDSGYIFIDSSDTYRNALFEENTQRYLNAQRQIVPLPVYDLKDKIVPYIGALSAEVTYKAKPSTNDEDLYLIILATMVRPNLQFVLDGSSDKILRTVAMLLDSNTALKYHEFFYSTDEGIQILQESDGKIRTQRDGLIPLRDAASKGALVPTVFGTDVLYQEPGWRDVFERILHILNDMRMSRDRSLVEALTEEVTED